MGVALPALSPWAATRRLARASQPSRYSSAAFIGRAPSLIANDRLNSPNRDIYISRALLVCRPVVCFVFSAFNRQRLEKINLFLHKVQAPLNG